jgi:hypothetical protein
MPASGGETLARRGASLWLIAANIERRKLLTKRRMCYATMELGNPLR